MHYPVYKAPAPRRATRGGTSPLTFVLLITVPALVAVAALRPR
ncbi:secreted proline-rich protein [Streptomyces sp. WM6386]|nr:secreted proline-rich protein [Streptomyces sp. WM6386]